MGKDLQLINQEGQDVASITSLKVGEMVDRRHDQVLRDINTVIEHMGGDHKSVESYFIESTYTNQQNREMMCYQLTKKGCELYATRMTGKKGTQFAVAYIEEFNELQDYKENVQQKLAENDVYTRADDLAHKFSVNRTINTFGNADFAELPVLVEEFREHLGTIRDSKVRLSRYDSMIKGLERMRGQLDIGLSHHVLEQYVQPLTKERYQLNNRINGGIKASQTKKIQQSEEEKQAMKDHIATLTPPSDTEYAVIFRHGFTFNRMYRDLPNGDKKKTKPYDKWFTEFPTYQLPDKGCWDVDWDKSLLVRFQFVTLENGGYDLDNVIKSAQDVIFNHYKVDDVIIDEANIKRPYFCERYEDGEIRVHISNII